MIDIEQLKRAADMARAQERQAERALAAELIEIGYKTLPAQIRPKLARADAAA